MKLDRNNLNHIEQVSRCLLDCIERFALVTEITTNENPDNWITNTIKTPLLNEINCFQAGQ